MDDFAKQAQRAAWLLTHNAPPPDETPTTGRDYERYWRDGWIVARILGIICGAQLGIIIGLLLAL